MVGAVLAAGCGARLRMEPPPIVLVTIDTLRADHLPFYGYDGGSTPHLDRLARESLVYDNAWSHAPLTLPAHVSLLTGTLPPVHGVRSNLGFRVGEDSPATLAERLRGAGYETHAAVSAYVLRRATGIDRGFDQFDDAILTTADATLGELERPGAETVARALEGLACRASDRFFLFVHLFEPHAPYGGPGERGSRRERYDAEITTADAALGRLLGALEEARLFDSSMIVVTADHGEGLGDHGEQEHGILLHREVLRVPLLVKLPRSARAGERISTPVAHFDVAPTLLEIAGLSPLELPGDSLLEPRPNRDLYAEALYARIHLGWSELRSLVRDRFHLIDGPLPELYDLESDPLERFERSHADRRTTTALRRRLASIPLDLAPASNVGAEERARLAALGYLGEVHRGAEGPRPDPKTELPWLARIREASGLLGDGEFAAAEALLAEVTRARPDLADARTLRASALRRMGRAEEALAEYREVAVRAPWLASSIALERAKTELSLGRTEAARAGAELAREVFPAEAEALLAEVEIADGNLSRAADHVRRARAAAPVSPPATLLLEARIESAAGRLLPALERLDRLEEQIAQERLRPLPTAAAIRGDVLARLGRKADAEKAFREELARFPGAFESAARLAVLLAEQHRFDEIEPLLIMALERAPSVAHRELAARTLELLGNRAGAAAIRSGRPPARAPS